MSGAGETVPGEGGLPKVIVHHDSGATAEVYLYGGQLMSYKTPNGQEVLFRSSKAVYDGKKAMRGGIPICFPQFAAQGPLPMHGFARTSTWELVRTANGYVELSLSDSDATRALWPHAFKLSYRISFDASQLSTSLEITNPAGSAGPFAFEALLHTYIYTGRGAAADSVKIEGLTGVKYISKPEGGAVKEQGEEAITLGSQVDRIYCHTPADVTVRGITSAAEAGGAAAAADGGAADGGAGGSAGGGAGGFNTVTVRRKAALRDAAPALRQVVENAPLDVVVWNIGAEAASGIADLGADDWKDYVCVEPGRVSPDTAGWHGHAALAPGKAWTITQTLLLSKE